MKLESKYNIGDKVWYISNNKVFCAIVYGVKFNGKTTNGFRPIIEYRVDLSGDLYYKENELFETKEELLKTL